MSTYDQVGALSNMVWKMQAMFCLFFLSRLRLIEIVHPCKFLQKPDAAEREYIWKNCRFRMHFTEERNITCTQVARALIMQLLPHITLHRNNADSESINCQWC